MNKCKPLNVHNVKTCYTNTTTTIVVESMAQHTCSPSIVVMALHMQSIISKLISAMINANQKHILDTYVSVSSHMQQMCIAHPTSLAGNKN